MLTVKRSTPLEYAIAFGLLLVALVAVVMVFERLPIEKTSLALDWKGLWQAFQQWPPLFGNETGLRLTPWNALLIAPLGLLSLRASWGLLSFFTLIILVASVPQTSARWLHWLGITLLCSSYLTLRLLADGNLEALVILGTLMIVAGYRRHNIWILAGGMLLATSKVQETWLLMLALAFYVLKSWPKREWIKLGLVLAVVIFPSLIWLGRDWLLGATTIQERGSIMDSSLWAAAGRLNLPLWLAVSLWVAVILAIAWVVWKLPPDLSREKAGMLIAVSLLLAPYAAGNSVLTVLAVAVIPIFLSSSAVGLGLILLVDALYFIPREILFSWSAYYWTAYLAIVIAVCATILLRPVLKAAPARTKEMASE